MTNIAPNPHFWAGKRVCVTGGGGFLGLHLVRQLRALGARVVVLSLPPASDHPLHADQSIEKVFGDVRDAETVRRASAGCAMVFHAAGVVAVAGPALKLVRSVHVEGTRQVLAAADRDATVVHTSSVVTIGASRTGKLLDEDSLFNLDHVRVDYIHAKRAAERLALEAAERARRVIVVNPAYLLGPEDYERSEMGRFCARFWKGQLWFAPPGGYNFVDVRDAATGHVLAAEHGQPGRRYILGGENHTFASFVGLLADVAGLRPRGVLGLPATALTAVAGAMEAASWLTWKTPFPSLQQARLNRYHWFYRWERARRELGYRSRPLLETLVDTYRWHTRRPLPGLRPLQRWWLRPAA
jgi:dihydroflavonol-4-reductase